MKTLAMASYSLDVENFIQEVHKHPELWNMHCEDYRHKHKKQQAWDSIGRVFINDYDDIPDIEKLDVYRKLHGKWRNIRDSYVRNLRRGATGHTYMYAKLLLFLDDVYKPREQSGSDVDRDHHDNTSQSDDEKPKLRTRKRKRKTSRALQNLNDTASWNSENDDLATLAHFRQKKEEAQNLEYVETQFSDQPISYGPVEDEDRSFFDSLLPAVRSFDLDQKLEFRSQIIALIKDIRSGNKS